VPKGRMRLPTPAGPSVTDKAELWQMTSLSLREPLVFENHSVLF
jgi:hypothetical protein